MKYSFEIKGLRGFSRAMSVAPKDLLRNTQEALKNSALRVRDVAKEIIISGRGYSKAPFQTGRMYKTMYARTDNPFQATIGSAVDYAIYPHEGLGSSRHYGRRPFLEDSLSENEDFIQKEFEEAVKKTLDNVARKV